MNSDPVNYSHQYDKIHPLLEFLDKKVCEILEDICHQPSEDSPDFGPPNIVRIESRIKDRKSFLDKIDRPGKSYKNPISDITDLIGFRIITYYKRDVEIVEQLLREEFYVDVSHSQDTFERLEPNEFGYLSRHFVVKLSHERLAMKEFRSRQEACRKQKFEIQVRTLLQHAWATLSHKLTYKAEHEAPRELRRKIAMLSALLETADDASVELQGLRQQIQDKYRAKIKDGHLEGILIDAESVSAYLQESNIAQHWWDIARDIGWEKLIPIPVDVHGETLEDAMDAQAEKDRKEKERTKRQISELIALLNKGRVERLSELDGILRKETKARQAYLEQLYERLSSAGEHLRASVHDILRAIVLNDKHLVITSNDLRDLDYDAPLVQIYSDLCNLND